MKTTIGWERPNKSANNPYKNIEERVAMLASSFSVDRDGIIYIFEGHGNVSKEFSRIFWDVKKRKPMPRPKEFPLSIIFPLFDCTDPYYWKHDKGLRKTTDYPVITDEQIVERAAQNIVTPFEDIRRRIIDTVPEAVGK